ncbi:MAG TPA: hypothetical protein VEZ20_01525 [Allosphingosinicella sp.]|jgi:hypothetical protein|nr:hypothetical protein [Allosphingosinicella sp.]
MNTNELTVLGIIAATVLLIVWAARRNPRRGRGAHDGAGDGAATGAFVFADTADSSSCDGDGDSGGGDCDGGGD